MVTQGIQCRGFVYIAINTYFYIAGLHVMKRFLLIVSVLFLPLIAARASEYDAPKDTMVTTTTFSDRLISSGKLFRYELNFGLGGEPLYAWQEVPLYVESFEEGPKTIKDMYANCYNIRIYPTASIGLAYNVYDWLAVVFSFGQSKVNIQYINPFTSSEIDREKCYMYDALVGLRFYIFHPANEEKITFYSQFLAGVTFHSPGEYWSKSYIGQKRGGFQITPVGITQGKRFFWMLELGFGTEFFGGRIGVGVHF